MQSANSIPSLDSVYRAHYEELCTCSTGLEVCETVGDLVACTHYGPAEG